MKRPHTFIEIERMVISELICNERALPLAREIATDDFNVPLHKVSFDVLRNVEADSYADLYRAQIECRAILLIADRLAATGKQFVGDRGILGALESEPDRFVVRLTELIDSAAKYGTEFETLFPRHLRDLRAIAEQRRVEAEAVERACRRMA